MHNIKDEQISTTTLQGPLATVPTLPAIHLANKYLTSFRPIDTSTYTSLPPILVCSLPSSYTSSHIYLSLFSTHKTAISFQQFPRSLSWSTTHNTMYHFFITRLNILPWRWQQHVLPKHWYLCTTLHSETTQNTVCNLNIFCHENLKFSILTLVT
jgi:hypothetical protein